MTINVGIVGAGAIGTVIAKSIDKNDKFRLAAVFDVFEENLESLGKCLDNKPVLTKDLPKFLDMNFDIVVEAASQSAVVELGAKLLEKADLLVMSVGAFSDDALKDELRAAAEKSDRKIIIPSGAVCGVDGLKSAKSDDVYEVRLVTTKNPKALDRDDKVRTVLFKGAARDAAKKFPKNLNICATLSLAGIGMDKTTVELVSDPDVTRNTHEVFVRGAFGSFNCRIENIPSRENPKTSYLAALSAVKTLEQIADPFRIGT